MISLERFFELQFNDPELSDERLAMFAEVHVARLEGNNPGGKYTALITPTLAKSTAFKTAMSDKKFLNSEREGTTLNLDNIIAEFKQFALKTEKMVNYTFGADSVAYQEFYPHSTSEYTHMTKTTASALMANMKSACQKHAASLPPALVTTMENLARDYDIARQAQQEKSASIEGKQDETDAARSELELQLQKNLLTLALDFIGQPDICHTYFETTLLKPYRSPSLEGNGGTTENGESNTGTGEVVEVGDGEITPATLP